MNRKRDTGDNTKRKITIISPLVAEALDIGEVHGK